MNKKIINKISKNIIVKIWLIGTINTWEHILIDLNNNNVIINNYVIDYKNHKIIFYCNNDIIVIIDCKNCVVDYYNIDDNNSFEFL